jgi:hypothetical protein
MIADIADLIVELSKERTEIDDPGRRLYAVYLELSAEIGKRLNDIRTEQRLRKKANDPQR